MKKFFKNAVVAQAETKQAKSIRPLTVQELTYVSGGASDFWIAVYVSKKGVVIGMGF